MSQATADSAQQTAGEAANAPMPESNQQEQATTTETGNSGEGGSGEVDSSSSDILNRVAGVNDLDSYEAMMQEVQMNPDVFGNAAENIGPEGIDQDSAPAEEATAPQEGEEVQEDQQPVEAQEDVEEEPIEEKAPQFRLRPTEKLDAEALRIMKAAEVAKSPITLQDAITIAAKNLQIENPFAAPQPAEQPEGEEVAEEDPTQGITLSEAKADLKDLRKQASQALRDGDLDEAADLQDRIGETEDLIDVIAERDVQQEGTARQQHDTEFQESVAKATDLFPDFGNDKSEFFKRCAEIDEALQATEDPRYFAADKPLQIARMAAQELNVAPGAKARKSAVQPAAPDSPSQQKSTSPQPPRTEKPGQIPAASGASRTAGTPIGEAASLAEQVGKVNSPADFERLTEELASKGIMI